MLLAPLAAQAAGLREEPPSTCVLADNYMNAQYTVPVQLGTPPQTVRAVPDTGSFELITSAAGCDGCSPHAEYDSSKSSTFTARGEVVETHFGQGEVVSEAHYDKVRVGGLSVEKQSILLMRTNGLRGFADASYDAVMGLGMQTSARRNDTDLSLMSSLGTSVASVCYGQRDGEKGRLVLGGGIKGLHYTELPVIGDLHWALRLDGMKIGDVDAPGCADPPHCSAIVDSGTSLIALPSVMIDDILKKIDAHGGVKSDCSNIDDLPTIYLSIGGTTVELPPQLYVAKLKDVQEEETVGWGLFKFPFQTGKLIEACLPLFMEMELATAFDGPVFILGMPFLRAYSTKFDRETRKIGAPPPPPRGPREPQTPGPHTRSPRDVSPRRHRQAAARLVDLHHVRRLHAAAERRREVRQVPGQPHLDPRPRDAPRRRAARRARARQTGRPLPPQADDADVDRHRHDDPRAAGTPRRRAQRHRRRAAAPAARAVSAPRGRTRMRGDVWGAGRRQHNSDVR